MRPGSAPVRSCRGVEPRTLVTGGLYRRSRNSQYLGLVAVLGGLAVASRSGLAAGFTAAAWAGFNSWIPSEERHLERIFGVQYRTHAARIPRWL
jgi:protein-S-isoprenylcysteine O-methyltransferase Ste14